MFQSSLGRTKILSYKHELVGFFLLAMGWPILFAYYYNFVELNIFGYLNRPTINLSLFGYFLYIPLAILGLILFTISSVGIFRYMAYYLYAAHWIPSLMLFIFNETSNINIANHAFFFSTLGIIVFLVSVKLMLPVVGIKRKITINKNSAVKITLLLGCMVLLYLGLTVKLTSEGFNLDLAYISRLESRDALGGSIPGYLLMLATSILAPLLTAYGISRRLIVASIIGLSLFILSFFASATKSSLLLMIGSVLIGVSTKNLRPFCTPPPARFIYLAFPLILLLLLVVAFYVHLNDLLMPSFFSRMFVLPAVSPIHYAESALVDGYFYLRDWGFVGNLIPGKGYTNLTKGFHLGEIYYNNSATNYNSTLWANAFLDLGYIGVILYSFILGILFSPFNVTKYDEKSVIALKVTLLFSYTYWLLERSFNGMLLGGGLLFLFITFALFRMK